jgi:hypothetical protein
MNQLAARWWRWVSWECPLFCVLEREKQNRGGEEASRWGVWAWPLKGLCSGRVRSARAAAVLPTHATAPTDLGTESGVFGVFFYI